MEELTDHQLHDLIQRWQVNDGRAADRVLGYLTKHNKHYAYQYARPWSKVPDMNDIINDALQEARLTMDEIVQSGSYHHENRNKLNSFFQKIVWYKIRDQLKDRGHTKTAAAIEGETTERRKPVLQFDGRLEESHPENGSTDSWADVYADEMEGPSPDPGHLVQDAGDIYQTVEDLAETAARLSKTDEVAGREAKTGVRERLHRKPAVVETIQAVITWIKLQVHPRWRPDMPITEQQVLLDDVKHRNVREIIRMEGIPVFSFEASDCWECVAAQLGLSVNAMEKRKQRMVEAIENLGSVPPNLHKVIRLLWRDTMMQWYHKAAASSQDLNNRGCQNEAIWLGEIADYVLWTYGQGHRRHKGKNVDQLLALPVPDLFRIHSPEQLDPTYPCVQQFFVFLVARNRNRFAEMDLEEVRTTVAAVKKATLALDPKPKSLISLFVKLEALPAHNCQRRIKQ